VAGHRRARRRCRGCRAHRGGRAVGPSGGAAGHPAAGLHSGRCATALAAAGARGGDRRGRDGRGLGLGLVAVRCPARAGLVFLGPRTTQTQVDRARPSRRGGARRGGGLLGVRGRDRTARGRGHREFRAAGWSLVYRGQRRGAATLPGRPGRAGGAGAGRRDPGGAGAHRPQDARRGRACPCGDHGPGGGRQVPGGQAPGGGERRARIDRDDQPDCPGRAARRARAAPRRGRRDRAAGAGAKAHRRQGPGRHGTGRRRTRGAADGGDRSPAFPVT
jgi:hypothetical protein